MNIIEKPVTNESNETNENTRKLASIQRITAINEIPGADRILCATVLGWECVIKKDEGYKVGDLIIFIEPDSILPDRKEFDFMRERKFRVKTIKLKKQISQGLIMPLSILPDNAECYEDQEGDDVTSVLGILKYDPQLKEENDMVQSQKNRSLLMRFLMGISLFRWVYLKLNSRIKGNWPVELFPKTDETRIQTCARKLMEHYNEEWYISEKIDGQSSSFFTYFQKQWGIHKKKFGVCSRNIFLKTRGKNNYWEMAEKYELENKLMPLRLEVVIQSEIAGPTIQKNKYKLSERDLFVFNVFINREQLGLEAMESFCSTLGLKTVPIVNRNFIPSKEIGTGKEVSDVVKFMIELSRGNSILCDRKREGVICRLKKNPRISFKVINPYFLLEEGE